MLIEINSSSLGALTASSFRYFPLRGVSKESWNRADKDNLPFYLLSYGLKVRLKTATLKSLSTVTSLPNLRYVEVYPNQP